MLSIVVPVHNGGRQLASCLQALQASSYHDFELLVVDDCSSDGSADVIHSHGARYLRTPARLGPAGARNLGAKAARGSILVFVDGMCRCLRARLSSLPRTSSAIRNCRLFLAPMTRSHPRPDFSPIIRISSITTSTSHPARMPPPFGPGAAPYAGMCSRRPADFRRNAMLALLSKTLSLACAWSGMGTRFCSTKGCRSNT